jgi:hypothetical protein
MACLVLTGAVMGVVLTRVLDVSGPVFALASCTLAVVGGWILGGLDPPEHPPPNRDRSRAA